MRRNGLASAGDGLLAAARLCVVWAAIGAGGIALADEGKTPLMVRSGDLAIELTERGELVTVTWGAKGLRQALGGGTRLAGMKRVGETVVQQFPDGPIQFTSKLVSDIDGREARLVESFSPTTDSIRWEIEITGGDTPWSTAIETSIKWPEPSATKWWTAWADPRPGGGPDWEDPLVVSPFVDRRLDYAASTLAGPDSLVVPLVTVLDESRDSGLSLVLSPEDLALQMRLTVGRDGSMAFSRSNHRIDGARPVRFAMNFVSHPADWRAGLDWMVRRYPAWFDPPCSKVHELAGCGAYSSHAAITSPQKLMRMAFRVNWKASYDFPFMGMFLPPTRSDTEEWIDFKGQKNSVARMRDYGRQMRRMGFHVVNYFNVTECGAHYQYPPPPRKAGSDADLWKDANDFLFHRMGEAILPGEGGKPIGSWEGCVAMDPGEPKYQEFLLEQARRHIEKLPETAGICIDRLDWVRCVNPRRDDGVSWVDGKPARSLAVSWAGCLERLGAMMHAAGKVIYVNPSRCAHLGWLRHVDGIYDEFGDVPIHLNRSGLLGLRKPVMAWTRDARAVRAEPDAYFQRHLHLGAYLTAPLPGNDHTILPAEDTDRYFLDYGPMLDALRGKRWCLRPHGIEVTGAKGNLFEVPGGYVVALTFGRQDRARVVLRGLPRLAGQEGFRTEMIHPGQGEWTLLKVTDGGERMSMEVPLVRGCAMVKLAYAWIEPKAPYIAGSVKVTMGTTLRDAAIRYTLDNNPPSPSSPPYQQPVHLDRTTTVRAAAFRGQEQLGDMFSVEFVKPPTDAPDFSPTGTDFDESMQVTLKPPAGEAGNGAIHYSLDGSEPTAASPRYSGPVELKQTTTVRAVVISPEREGCVGSATFHRRGPKPPAPDVWLSNLAPLRATTGWGSQPRMNRSIWDKPLRLGGTEYAKGVGVHANSELEYELKPEYGRFVAVVGVDDAMKDHTEASVVFEVWIDGKRVEQTRILHGSAYEYINVAIPPGGKVLRLVVTDAIDGHACDHGDWANAGFVRRGIEN